MGRAHPIDISTACDGPSCTDLVTPAAGCQDATILRISLGSPAKVDSCAAGCPCGEDAVPFPHAGTPWNFSGWSCSVAAALCEIAHDLTSDVIGFPFLNGALGELSEDVAAHAVPCAAVFCHVTVGAPGHAAIYAAGLDVPSWITLHAVTAAAMCAGEYNIFRRMPMKPDRRAQHFGAAALACSAAVHMFQACGGLPFFFPEIADQLCVPDVVMHYLGDIVILPLMLTAYAHLAGREMNQLLPVTALSIVGVAGFVVSGAVDDSAQALGSALIGVAALWQASNVLNRVLPSTPDMQRLYTSKDLFVFGWLILAGARCLACCGEISELTEDNLIVMADILSKIGVCHLALKPPLLA